MQWLIDIVKEWTIAQNYLTQGFVSRGDPANADFELGNFTTDNAFHDLDLSAIVPADAKAASICTVARDTTDIGSIKIQRSDYNSIRTMGGQAIIKANRIEYEMFTISMNTDRKIKYSISASGWNFLTLTVAGWWF